MKKSMLNLCYIFAENAVAYYCETGVVEIPKTSLLCREIGRRRRGAHGGVGARRERAGARGNVERVGGSFAN